MVLQRTRRPRLQEPTQPLDIVLGYCFVGDTFSAVPVRFGSVQGYLFLVKR